MAKAAEDIYKRYFHIMPTMMGAVDFDGRFTELNEGWQLTLGYSAADLAGKPCLDIVHPEDRALVAEHQRELKEGKSNFLFEARFLCRDGSWKWLYLRCASDREKGRIYVVATDITPRKRTEEALRESEATLRSLIENSPLPMGIQTVDGRIELFNSAYTALYGYTAADTPDRGAWIEAVAPDPAYRAELAARFDAAFGKAAAAGGHLEPVEFDFACKDGSRKTVSIVGVTVGGKIFAIFEDRTERLKAVEALRESEATLRKIIDNAPMAMAIVAMDGTIEYINRKAVEVFGYPHSDIPNMDRWWERAYPDPVYRKQVVENWMGRVYKAWEAKTEIPGDEFLVTCKDGTKKTCFIFGVIAAGKVFVMFDDITRRVNAETALRESAANLRQVIEQLPIAMTIVSLDGRLEFANRKFSENFGYTPDDIRDLEDMGRRAYPDEAYRREVMQYWAGVAASARPGMELPPREFRVRCKDGTTKTVRCSSVITPDGKIVTINDDITARLLAEQAVKDSERNLRQILQQAPVAIAIQNFDNTIAFINRKFTDFFGYAPEDIPTLSAWAERAYPDPAYRAKLVEGQRPSIEKAMETNGEMAPVEVVVTCKDGSRKNVLVTGIVTPDRKIVSLLDDITERVKAANAIRESEATLRRILEQAPICIGVHTLDGRVEFLNTKFRQMFGYTLEDLPDLDAWARKAYPDEAYRKQLMGQWRENTLKSVKTGREMDGMTVRIVCRDGSVKTAALNGVVTADGKVLAVFDDITARAEAERALRERESLYRSLIETTGTGYVVLDGLGRVLDANREYVRLSGHQDLKDIVGRHVSEWVAPASQDRSREAFDLVRRDGRIAGYELQYVNKAGKTVTVEINGTIVERGGVQQILGLVRDVSARSKTEAHLRDSESLYRALVETTRTGYVVIDMQGRVLDANKEYVRLTGHADLKEILGRPVTEWTAPDLLEDNAAAVRKCAQDGFIFNYETDYIDGKGKRTPIEINATVVRRAGLPQIHTLCRDITDRRRQEAELKALNQGLEKRVSDRTAELSAANMELTMEIAQRIDSERAREKLQQELLQSQKLEAVGQLAGGIAHDFNNILVAISGYAEFLLKAAPPGSSASQDLNEILRETERGALLTRQLIAISRRQPLKLERLDVNAVVEDTCRMLKRLVGANVHLVPQLAPDLCAIKADRGQVAQVILNLVINARDAMPEGGTITVATANEEVAAGGAGLPLPPAPGSYAVLTVADTGSGIARELAAKIFEPFFTTKPEGKGTGLGLSTVCGIVQQARGGLLLASEPGKGSSFRVYLPRAADQA